MFKDDLRKDLSLSIMQLVFAILFCVIYYNFLTSFGGEFLIVVKGIWLLPIFITLLMGGAIASVTLSMMSLRSGKLWVNKSDRFGNPSAKSFWLIGWSACDILISVPILQVGKILTLGALGSIPTPLIGLLAFPFIVYAFMFVMGSVKSLVALLRHQNNARLMRGAALLGFPFLFVFISFGIIAALWNPQWTPGVQHTVLFAPGEEPGRADRIPAMVVLPGDTVLAFAESRIRRDERPAGYQHRDEEKLGWRQNMEPNSDG